MHSNNDPNALGYHFTKNLIEIGAVLVLYSNFLIHHAMLKGTVCQNFENFRTSAKK